MNQDAPARQPLPDDVQPRPDQLATGGTPDSDTGSAPVHSFTPRFHHSTPSIPDHELLRCIGGGSYGEVWLARNVLGDYRAVKVIYREDRKSTRLNSSHVSISYAVFCLK